MAVGPAVSIILPTFNRLEFLPATIGSVFAQSFSDWELIIADDGSGAATRAFLRELESRPRVRVLWLPHSGTPSVARNEALQEAQGEYVAFLDSDDLWMPTKLAVQLAALGAHGARKWSCTRFGLIDASGQPTVGTRPGGWPAPTGWIFEDLLKQEAVIALPSVVVSRRLLQEAGAFDETLVMCEDDDLWIRLAARSEIEGVDETLTLVRRHREHCGNAVIGFSDRMRVIEKVLRVGNAGHLTSALRKQRAQVSTDLARSHAAAGNRLAALRTLASSAAHSWHYSRWWFGASEATLRALAPEALVRVLRRYKRGNVSSQPSAAP